MTDYVRQEFNRAEALENNGRAGTVGFALTILQRRLASSPEAIYQSLRRRKERLESRLRELELLQRGGAIPTAIVVDAPVLDAEDVEELEEAPDDEVEAAEEQILDQATAARTIAELKAEIETLRQLEGLALAVRRSGTDRKWRELATLLSEIFTPAAIASGLPEERVVADTDAANLPKVSASQKLVIFTEHRDTLSYLEQRISTLLGRKEAVVCIHGGMGREERMKTQEFFRHDPEVKVLLATDAAGEGINLQRAHLMVNYDLPWNPNRIEQRFGRIHRIGQTEVCHLWNLIAEETREGEVYLTLLEKLNEARRALGGQVFDILGKVVFEGRPLRELLVEAIRYGDQPEVRARLSRVVANAFNREELRISWKSTLSPMMPWTPAVFSAFAGKWRHFSSILTSHLRLFFNGEHRLLEDVHRQNASRNSTIPWNDARLLKSGKTQTRVEAAFRAATNRPPLAPACPCSERYETTKSQISKPREETPGELVQILTGLSGLMFTKSVSAG